MSLIKSQMFLKEYAMLKNLLTQIFLNNSFPLDWRQVAYNIFFLLYIFMSTSFKFFKFS